VTPFGRYNRPASLILYQYGYNNLLVYGDANVEFDIAISLIIVGGLIAAVAVQIRIIWCFRFIAIGL
jgi:hypothetical protein